MKKLFSFKSNPQALQPMNVRKVVGSDEDMLSPMTQKTMTHLQHQQFLRDARTQGSAVIHLPGNLKAVFTSITAKASPHFRLIIMKRIRTKYEVVERFLSTSADEVLKEFSSKFITP